MVVAVAARGHGGFPVFRRFPVDHALVVVGGGEHRPRDEVVLAHHPHVHLRLLLVRERGDEQPRPTTANVPPTT